MEASVVTDVVFTVQTHRLSDTKASAQCHFGPN